MADIFSKEKRSLIMSKVKSSRNKTTELKLISFFKERGITGWRRNTKVFGKPDFVFRDSKIAVFVDGCFWHGHKCRNTTPKNNAAFWTVKIARNKKRDSDVAKTLKKQDWKVVRIWECELLNKNREKLIKKLSPLNLHK